MPANGFILGARCACDKTDAARGFASGEFFVVHSVSAAGDGNTANILSFGTAAEADAVGLYVAGVDTSPAAQAAHDSAVLAAIATVNGVTRSRAGVFSMSTQWGDLFRPVAPVGGGGGGGGGHGVDALLGTTISGLSIPIMGATGTVMSVFTGAANIAACASDPAAYTLSFTDSGVARTAAMAMTVVQAHAALAAPVGSSPITVNTAASSVLVETLLRALPASSALPPGKVCALEALEVFKAAGIPTPFTDPAGLGFGAMFLGYCVRLATMLASPSAAARTWPNMSPVRLGGEIAAFCSRGVSASAAASAAPPARFPRAEALLKLASSDAERDSFLTKSVDVTVDADKPGHAVRARGSEFIRSGALDAYLGRCGAVGSVASISARAGGLGSEELVALIMFDIAPALSSGAAAHPSMHGGISVNVTQPDLSGTDDERRMRLQLRNDAASVASDAAAMVSLGALSALTAPASSTALHIKVRDLTHDGLKRVVNTSQDIEKALVGAPFPFHSHTLALRLKHACTGCRAASLASHACHSHHTRPCPRFTCVCIPCSSHASLTHSSHASFTLEPCLVHTLEQCLAARARAMPRRSPSHASFTRSSNASLHALEQCLAALHGY